MRRIGDQHRNPGRDLLPRQALRRGRGGLGIPVGTVKSRVYYALRALRIALEEIGYEG